MTQYYGNGMTLNVKGKEVYLSQDVINELHRQENIQWGKDIVANYVESIGILYERITDDEFVAVAEGIEEQMMDDNGGIELEVIWGLFGEAD